MVCSVVVDVDVDAVFVAVVVVVVFFFCHRCSHHPIHLDTVPDLYF